MNAGDTKGPSLWTRLSGTQRRLFCVLTAGEGAGRLVRRQDSPGFYDAAIGSETLPFAARRGTVLALVRRKVLAWTGGLDPERTASTTEKAERALGAGTMLR